MNKVVQFLRSARGARLLAVLGFPLYIYLYLAPREIVGESESSFFSWESFVKYFDLVKGHAVLIVLFIVVAFSIEYILAKRAR